MLTTSVIIITKDRPTTVIRTIQSLHDGTKKPMEILIVDSSQDNQTKLVIEKMKKKLPNIPIRYFHIHPKGISHALNYGIKRARGSIVSRIDDDEYADTKWIQYIQNTFTKYPMAKAVTGSVIPAITNNYWNQVWGEILKDSYTFIGKTNFIFGSNAAYRKEIFSKDHFYFDEKNRGVAADDSYISFILQSHGYIMIHNYHIKVFHDFRTSFLSFWLQWLNYGMSDYRLFQLHPEIFIQTKHPSIVDCLLAPWGKVKMWTIRAQRPIHSCGLLVRSLAYSSGIIAAIITKKQAV